MHDIKLCCVHCIFIEYDDAPPVPPPPSFIKGVAYNDYYPYGIDDLGESNL